MKGFQASCHVKFKGLGLNLHTHTHTLTNTTHRAISFRVRHWKSFFPDLVMVYLEVWSAFLYVLVQKVSKIVEVTHNTKGKKHHHMYCTYVYVRGCAEKEEKGVNGRDHNNLCERDTTAGLANLLL